MATMTLGVLHAGQVLDGARNAHGHVQLRRPTLPVWPLVVVRRVAGVYNGAGCAHGSAQLVGQRLDPGLELLSRTQCAATRHHDLGGSQFRAVRHGEFLADKAGQASVSSARDGFHGGGAAGDSSGFKAVVRTVITLMASLDCTVAITLPAYTGRIKVGAFHCGDFADLGDIQQGGHARQQVLPKVVARASTWLYCCQIHHQRGGVLRPAGGPGAAASASSTFAHASNLLGGIPQRRRSQRQPPAGGHRCPAFARR